MHYNQRVVSTRVIVKRLNGHWTAWFSDRPQAGCTGRKPVDAIGGLLAAQGVPIPPHDLISHVENWGENGFEFVLPACPDCRGRGQYVGLTLVERCRTCQGSGYHPAHSAGAVAG
jgi:hypothetical protein